MKSRSIVRLSNHVYNASPACRGTRCKVQVNVKVNSSAFLNRLLESELNRAQLVRDVAELKVGAGKLNGRAKSFASIVSSTAVLVSALTAFRHGKPNAAGVKSSWLQTLLKS